MKKIHETNSYHPISESQLHLIRGGGGWMNQVLWFVINNWGEIKDGLKDGFNAYQEKQ